MPFFTNSWIMDMTSVLAITVALVYLYYQKKFRYWKNLKVAHPTPSIPLGNMGNPKKLSFGEIFREIYEAFPSEKFIGVWVMYKPTLIVRDPELIKHIFVKDFASFHDRGIYVNEKDDPLAAHLFTMEGAKWKNLRAKLSPTFTSGKMKKMFPVMIECGEELAGVLKDPASNGQVVEVKDLAARFTTDMISSCAFGIQTNSLKNPDAIFRVMGKKIFQRTASQAFKKLITTISSKLAELFHLAITRPDVSEFFIGVVKETMEYRRSTGTKRNDFMQLLIQLNTGDKLDDAEEVRTGSETPAAQIEGDKLTFLQAAANAFVFFVAGFETSSTTIQYALYELAKNEDIQEKTREEIHRVLKEHDGVLTYEAVKSMKYLSQVIDETLRKYPAFPILQRKCNRDFPIPNSDVVLQAGTQIQIPIFGLHHDPKYYPDPERFDPNRFSEEEKSKRQQFTYLPFGDGPRSCIGMRFALLQTEVGLIAMLRQFKWTIADGTKSLKFDPKSFVLSPKDGMHLKITQV